jgi:hypothetical protein
MKRSNSPVICSCQKQDSAAEQQLPQQKADLDAREKALDERLNALDERVNALDKRVRAVAEKEKATANAQTAPPDVQPQDVVREAAQMKALMADPSLRNSAKIEKDRLTQERRAQRQAELGGLQSQRPHKSKMSGMAVLPAAESSPTPLTPEEATSPTSSPTPQ